MQPAYKTLSPGIKNQDQDPIQSPGLHAGMKVIIVGAGIFGCWTALKLQQRGIRVTLIDAYGPGNRLSSSGGKSRLMRTIYGDNQLYTELASKAYLEWKDFEEEAKESLLEITGVAWMLDEHTENLVTPSKAYLENLNLPCKKLEVNELEKILPIDPDGLTSGFIEYNAGYLHASKACKTVAKIFLESGGQIIKSWADPIFENDKLTGVRVGNQSIKSDFYIFATGPWHASIFPGLLKHKITVTRQSVLFFELPEKLKGQKYPAWIEFNTNEVYYGLFEDAFKIALDERGIEWDPSTEVRELDKEEVHRYREFIQKRFPVLANSKLSDHRVCQYSNTEDGNLFIDLHPTADNLLIMGGGSGHSFKYGPALGRLTSDFLCGSGKIPVQFKL